MRDLDATEVRVDGGEAVNFLFPVWPPAAEETVKEATDVATFIVGMNLEPKARLAGLAALGASLNAGALDAPAPLTARAREALPSWKDLRGILLMGAVAIITLVALIAMTLAAAPVLLMVLWVVLGWFTAPLRWLRGATVGI